MKRIAALLSGFVAAAVTAGAVIYGPLAQAAGPNLVANPGFETASGTLPASWSSDKWGTNTAAFTYDTTGHSGSRSATVTVSGYSSGDAKWYFAPVSVTPGAKYTFSSWYKSSVASGIDAVVTTTTGSTSYIWIGNPAASTTWKQQTYSFTAPSNAKTVTFYHYLEKNGTLSVDDYSFTNDAGTTTPPANTSPVVSLTAPAANATVSGTVNVTANATDDKAVANVQFKLDGANLGAADTTSPYSASWDSKTAANGNHTLTAVATDSDGAQTTSAAVIVNAQNAVTPAPIAPTVKVTSPAGGTNLLTGTVNVTADASDDKGVANVQFKLDGNNLGSADTTAPYSASWDTTTATRGVHALTAVATDIEGLSTTSEINYVNVDNTTTTPTPPAVNITAPAANAIISGKTVTVSAGASSAQGIANVQFQIDGINFGAADTTEPYSIVFDSTTVTNGSHYFSARATTNAGMNAGSTNVSVTVNNPTAPTVSITAPANNATLSGTQTVTANAGGSTAITGVQFKLDGNNLGAVDTTAPYSVTWDTKTVADGSTHTLTAVATNSASLATTSAPVTVKVSNPVTPPSTNNLIANPSVETATNNLPASWVGDGWGTNTRSLTYETNGQDGTRSVKAAITSYTNGDAKWYFNPVAVTPGTAYAYGEYYKSNVDTEVDAMVTLADGSVQYYWLGSVLASPTNWTKLNMQFTAPANASTVTIFHVISKVGYVQTDNFSFAKYTPAQFSRGLVTLTFDDGWRSIYTNGLPLLQKYGLTSTQYLNSQPIVDGYPDYMTYQMVKDYAAAGHELGWHTRTHADVTKLTATQLDTELTIPAAFLTGIGKTSADFKHFATPFGAYNSTAVTAIMNKYQSHRSTDVGYNSKDNFDIRNIKVQNITNTTTPADVQSWVNQAIANKTWLVIVYHEVDTAPEDPTYAVTPANLDVELNAIKQSGAIVKTMDAALAEVRSQL